MSSYHTITEANFQEEVLSSETPVLVDFWAPWCGPCQQMAPIIEELAHEYQDKGIKVGKLNVDENGTIANQYKVMSIPTFIVFKGGQVVDQVVGGVQKGRLEEVLEKHKV
ncbi:MAG: thioredoxin [Candidatus Magasanikbacteria bacterium]|nr:thioredoxin [Candidatus Magasanikbacteria bacterium]